MWKNVNTKIQNFFPSSPLHYTCWCGDRVVKKVREEVPKLWGDSMSPWLGGRNGCRRMPGTDGAGISHLRAAPSAPTHRVGAVCPCFFFSFSGGDVRWWGTRIAWTRVSGAPRWVWLSVPLEPCDVDSPLVDGDALSILLAAALAAFHYFFPFNRIIIVVQELDVVLPYRRAVILLSAW
jgi:hypothetical protein